MTAPRMVYLATPIDQVANDNLGPAVDEIRRALLAHGVEIIYSPSGAFMVLATAKAGPEIANINIAAIEEADAIVAILPAGTPTIGVPMEIQYAVAQQKPVAVLTDVNSWSLQIDGVATFGLDAEGVVMAVIWLTSLTYGERASDIQPLPFMVVRKAECGRVTSHAPHDFGEHMEEDCFGQIDLTPVRSYNGDAGWDLVVAETMTIPAYSSADVPMGVAVALPGWAFGRITGRSSTFRNRGLLVVEGIIDSGWRGELFAHAINPGAESVEVKKGERIAQLIIHQNDSAAVRPVRLPSLPAGERGTAGFGSTGV